MITIELSSCTFNQIADELIRTGHEDLVIMEKDRTVTIDMHGICFIREATNVVAFPAKRFSEEVATSDFNPNDDGEFDFSMLKGFE